MSEPKEFHFFYSKLHLFHLATNIGLAPVLFYILRIWEWPPEPAHFGVFGISAVVAFYFVRRRMVVPKLSVTQEGVMHGRLIPADIIYQITPTSRAVTLTLFSDNQVRQRIIHLGWASAEDRELIQKVLTERFNRELPKEAFGE